MRPQSTTSTAPSRLERLTRRLEQAEAAYSRHPTRANLSREVAAYHAVYWAAKATGGRR
jgi:hypothetical protein